MYRQMAVEGRRNIAILIWINIAINFGALLFFSKNGNIMNPEMPIWPSVIKDVVWILLVGECVRNYAPRDADRCLLRISYMAGFILFVIGALVFVKSGLGFDIEVIKSLKNATLYMWLPLILVAAWNVDFVYFRNALIVSLAIAIIISIILYFSIERQYKSFIPDLRMFGSSGNPNTSSVLSCMLFILISSCYFSIPPIARRFLVGISFFSVCLSASYFYILFSIVAAVYFTVMRVGQTTVAQTKLYWAELVCIAGIVWFAGSGIMALTSTEALPLELRLQSALEMSEHSGIADSDSIRIRVGDLRALKISAFGAAGTFRQLDSATFSFAENFGIPGMLFALYPAIIAMCALVKARMNLRNCSAETHLLMVVAALITLSGLIHYQISHFPSNAILFLTLAFVTREAFSERAVERTILSEAKDF